MLQKDMSLISFIACFFLTLRPNFSTSNYRVLHDVFKIAKVADIGEERSIFYWSLAYKGKVSAVCCQEMSLLLMGKLFFLW